MKKKVLFYSVGRSDYDRYQPILENLHKRKIDFAIALNSVHLSPKFGYTFKFIDKKSDQLLKFLEKETDFRKFNKKTRFWYYDRIFLDVLYYQNHLGSHLFERLFLKNKIERIFRFLDDESNILDDLKILLSFPKYLFTKTFFKTLFNK